MKKMQRFADVCWEGFTLQHVSNKEVVIPYVVFFILTFIFELFLALLFISSVFIFGSFGYQPNFLYYLSGVILMLMLLMTVPLLMTTIKGNKTIILAKK
ncbi:hypothetical protein [Neobacillus cucumis]|uniref:hypothetical protein n=1 Tax=Neobacillus cucumis TaxID=1740721 RepID=UPI001964FC93|nr:hypothetical protein [Neobacillus cucumis]MBM7652593.1 magnesium-transporting ATPase (P-type) [Neobacillus cucumis]